MAINDGSGIGKSSLLTQMQSETFRTERDGVVQLHVKMHGRLRSRDALEGLISSVVLGSSTQTS